MIATIAPRLIYESLSQANFGLLALTLDLTVPPLTLLGMLVSVILAFSAFAVLFGLSSSALVVSAVSFSGYVLTVLVCWFKFGRDILPFGSILSVPSYVFGKLPLYRQILFGSRGSQWVRTDRDKPEKGAD
jgi:hypothetical protein